MPSVPDPYPLRDPLPPRLRLQRLPIASRRPARRDSFWEQHLAELAERAARELELFPAPPAEGGDA
jgi:hypothetical protein